VVTDAPIRPIEEATTSVSNAADAYWKTVGSFVCIANLAACGVYGLVKSPPAMVQAMESMRNSIDSMRDSLKGVGEGLQNIKPRPVIQNAIRNGDIPNIPSIPRIPGVR